MTEVKTAGRRAADLTRQLLAFSRRQVLEPRPLDLGAVLADLEKMLRRLIGEDIDLVTHYKPDLGTVMADPGQIEQVVMNLVVNARDAMPAGGKLTIETLNVDLDESYSREHADTKPGPHVMPAVTDNGVGMDEEVRSKIFEPFFTTKEKGKGTGLGLATVYGIVKQSGGNIFVYSEPGRGTTFKVYFPRVDEAAASLKPDQPEDEVRGGMETILVVEDEGSVRELICLVLRDKGYRVAEAAGGEEALALADGLKGEIHMVLTDVVMPGLSGSELARRLIAGHPGIKVLYASGYTDDAIAHHGILEPGVNLITKPMSPASLARKVREVLDAADEDLVPPKG
ncbi:MAG: response regulator [Proteobacteria bacterium]|nr:response regulator [Pseudomonadota bacterium]